MMLLIAIFIPPLYLAIRRKWGALIVNAILYLIAVILALTIVFLPAGIFFWLLAFGQAAWHLRKQSMLEHAEMIATAMAKKQGLMSVPREVAPRPAIPESVFCSACGASNLTDSRFCESCGAALRRSA